MKLQFKDIRVGDVLKNINGWDKGSTIKVEQLHQSQIRTIPGTTFSKDYLEQNFEFVKRTEFKVGDKVRLVRSVRNPKSEYGWIPLMSKAENDKTKLTVLIIEENYLEVKPPISQWEITVELRHIVPVFETEEILNLDSDVKSIDNRISLLEEKIRNMTEWETELEELKLAKKIIMKYM